MRGLVDQMRDTTRYATTTLHLITAWDLLRDIDHWCGKDYPNWQLLQATIKRITQHLENTMESNTTTYGDIGWAINHVRHGHKMRRESWQKGWWIQYDKTIPNGNVMICHDAVQEPYDCTQRDMLATDWEMFDPLKPGEYHAAA